MSDDEQPPIIDYTAIDEVTGFKAADITIWAAFAKDVLAVPEEERPDPDTWAEEWASEHHYSRKRVRAVTVHGIYAGPRDEFHQRSGTGKAHYSNGDIYEGDFSEGRKHGQGHYTFVKQGKGETDTLIENMVNDNMKKQTALNPDTSADGTKSSDCPIKYADADFIDYCAAYLKIGRVIIESALEYGYLPCYHGDYVRGFRTGQGVMKNRDGSVYKGDFRDNKRHGQGMFYYVNGDVYSGEWAEGLKHGFGTYRFIDGGEYRGEWCKGRFVEGQWIMSDGVYYEGKFDKKNRPGDDAGVMHIPHLNIRMRGSYKMGRWAPTNKLSVSHEVPVDENAWTE
eukprot:Tbor_TRINITY_DN1838_c0_g1::TRINITY_DN1838_c0_g1_i1::g.23051::m.23051